MHACNEWSITLARPLTACGLSLDYVWHGAPLYMKFVLSLPPEAQTDDLLSLVFRFIDQISGDTWRSLVDTPQEGFVLPGCISHLILPCRASAASTTSPYTPTWPSWLSMPPLRLQVFGTTELTTVAVKTSGRGSHPPSAAAAGNPCYRSHNRPPEKAPFQVLALQSTLMDK